MDDDLNSLNQSLAKLTSPTSSGTPQSASSGSPTGAPGSPASPLAKESKGTPVSAGTTPTGRVEKYSPAEDQDVLEQIDKFDAQRQKLTGGAPPADLFALAMSDTGLLTPASVGCIPWKERGAFETEIEHAGLRRQVSEYSDNPSWDKATTIFYGFAAIKDGLTACELINEQLAKFARDAEH